MSAALEDIKTINLTEWLTLATAPSPTKLKAGQSPAMENVWVDEKPGSVITAPGYIKVGQTPSNNPSPFCINFFRTAAGTQTFVVSDNSTVWTTVDFQTFTPIITGLSSVFQLRGKVIRDKLWLTNGSDAVRIYDGTNVTVLDGTGGTPNVPKGRYIDYYDERVWLYHIPSQRSQAAFSALTDSSGTIIAPDNVSAWPSSNTLQISEGDADFGTGMILYRGYLHFFKQYSIWRLAGYDEYTYTRVKTRASTGTRFNESIQILDSLIHLIGIDGIYIFDGEETERISDIIDPATATQTAFGFNQLQQPNSNNQFFEVSTTADWRAGTFPTNASPDNKYIFEAVDDTQANFQAGSTLTNIDTTEIPGSIKLSRQSAAGGSTDRIGQGINAYLDDSGAGATVYGSPSYLTDGDESRYTGLGVRNTSFNSMVVDLSADKNTMYEIGEIIVSGTQGDTQVGCNVEVNTGTYQTPGGNQGTWVNVGSFTWADNGNWTPLSRAFDFTPKNAVQVRISWSIGSGSYQCSEIKVYTPMYQLSGKFVSKILDYTIAPTSYGNFNADYSANGQTVTFFTQSSNDGISWDAEIVCTNGSPVGSTIKRYLRWGVNFSSDGTTSPVLSAAYLLSEYISVIHDTGGNIFSWGAFEADRETKGQIIAFYYRGATTSGGVSSASWNLIVPSGVLNFSTNFRYIQFKFEIYGGNASGLPIVHSVTINWVTGTGVQTQVLQNVASAYWRNRYWLSAAGPSATSNNTILIRGKKTFASPWQLKDWSILSFTRFQDNFYGCSSIDGSIYQLDTGYSKAGSAMDSYFETGDFSFGGFYINPKEILLEVERMGSYNLTLSFSINRGNTWNDYLVDLTPSSWAPSYWKRINLDTVNTDRIRFRVRTNGIDQPFQVHNLLFFYNLESARGSIK